MHPLAKSILTRLLRILAQLTLRRYQPRVIAVAGSIGKTTTKDAIYAALKEHRHVRKSAKSYNTEIGIPLTVIGIPNGWNNWFVWVRNIAIGLWRLIWPQEYPKWLVLEVGIGKPYDMDAFTSWLRTDYIVYTTISQVPPHVEYFSSREALVAEKFKLIQTLRKRGTVIVNADDPTFTNAHALKGVSVLTYGFTPDADITGGNVQTKYNKDGIPEGMQFRVDYDGKSVPVICDGQVGKNHLYAALATLAVTYAEKISPLQTAQTLRSYARQPGRMNLIFGVKGSMIIDDTYNASPDAMIEAINTLKDIDTQGRRIAIVGDMLELGEHADEVHTRIGEVVAFVDLLVVVGEYASAVAAGAIQEGLVAEHIEVCESAQKAGKFVEQFIGPRDVILVKGSQGMRLERAVEEVMAHPEKKAQYLVRQEPQWLAKV